MKALLVFLEENKFEITPRPEKGEGCNDPDKCKYDIDLKINVPIPNLNA
jgi:hypothetical protein